MFSCLKRSSKKTTLRGSKFSVPCNTYQWQCSSAAAGNGPQCLDLAVPLGGSTAAVGTVCMDLDGNDVVMTFNASYGWYFTSVGGWAGLATDVTPDVFTISNTFVDQPTTASLRVPVGQLQACPAAAAKALSDEELAALSQVASVVARASLSTDLATVAPGCNAPLNTVQVSVQTAANLNLNCCCEAGAQGDCPCEAEDVVGVDCPCVPGNVPGPLACPCIPPWVPDVTCPCTPGPQGNCPCTNGRVPGVDCPCTPGAQGNCPCEEQQQPGVDCPCPSNNPNCTTPNHPLTCNTIYAKDGTASQCFLGMGYNFTRWGWTNGPFPKGSSGTMTLYGGAGQCNTSKGYNAGTLFWSYGNDGTFVGKYVDSQGYGLSEAQLYVGAEPLPRGSTGTYTVAPGTYGNINTAPAGSLMRGTQFNFVVNGAPDTVYIVAHASSCPLAA